jgi:hypothetical protein
MNNTLKALLILVSFVIFIPSNAQNNYAFEDNYMKCMCSLFEDEGKEFKSLIQKAEQTLISAELLKDKQGESYIALFKNIRTTIDGRIASFGISDYVINSLVGSQKAKTYSKCMQGMMETATFKDSKISKFIALSTSGNNPKITELTDKMLEIFEAKDFNHEFYKYLTFSLIDKYNVLNQKKK